MNKTGIKQNEEFLKQLSYVSHEIRNNISICDMYSEIIKKNLQKEGLINSSVENALECIQQSMQIINTNLMELKSLNENDLKIYDFKSIVLKGTELAKGCIRSKNINIITEINETADIKISKYRYLSCIINIIKNASEAVEDEGQIKITGEIINDKVHLRIANNGSPIPDNIKNNIFDHGYTTKEQGSGYGLCICRQYLESQNSHLNLIKSDENETVFEIITPLA